MKTNMWRLWSILVLALLGVGVSGYLTYVKLSHTEIICLEGDDCETVQNSPYAQVGPIPVALIGLIGYLAFIAVTAAQLRANPETQRMLAGLNFGLALGAFLYSAYLTYLELFVIYAICSWCVISAVLVTLILLLTTWELVALSKYAELSHEA